MADRLRRHVGEGGATGLLDLFAADDLHRFGRGVAALDVGAGHQHGAQGGAVLAGIGGFSGAGSAAVRPSAIAPQAGSGWCGT